MTLRGLWSRLRGRRRFERELDEELRCHLELLADEKASAGAVPEEAARQARLELGGLDQVKEAVRDVRPGAALEAVWQDARYAVRQLSRSPGFSLVAIVTLALGIGANSAIFSVLDAALIQPLPYPDPSRLVMVWPELRAAGQARVPASGPQLTEIRRRSRLLSDVGGIWVGRGSVTGEGDPERVRVGQVTANFLSLLGVAPEAGRTFSTGDEGPAAPRLAILSDAFWRRRFGGDPRLVGRPMRLDGELYTVVGVMPAGFDVILPSDASVPPGVEVWTPFRDDLSASPRDLSYIRTIARLRPGSTVAQARSELAKIAEGLRAEFREYATQGLGLDAAPLHAEVSRDVRPALLALFGGVGLVVLIACANVANLLLARATRRRREIGLRAALGASRARIVRQLLCESLVLAGAGGALGLAVGWGGLKLLLALRPASLFRILPAGLEPGVVVFTFGLSLATGVLCGLAPALALARRDLSSALKEGNRGGTPGRTRPQRVLVLAEVALGFVLLMGAGLLVRTFVKLLGADPGFRPAGVLTFQAALPDARYRDDGARQRLFRQVQERVGALPGVEAVGAVSHLPLDDYPNWYEYYWRDGAPAAEQNVLMADHRAILPGFFGSLGAELVAGRDITAADDAAHPNVIVVDESLARRTWPGQDPLGKRLNVTFIHDGSFDPTRAEVVGVVRPLRYRDLTSDVRGQVYVPYLQSAREQLTFTVRTRGDPGLLSGPIRREVARLDPDLALSRVRPLTEYVAEARKAARFTTAVAGALAGLALMLAGIGIYGVLAYAVAQRTREIGVRMALGGRPRDILGLVAGQAFVLVGAGLAAGLLGSLALTGLLSRLLYGVGPHDLPTILGAALVLAATGALAAYLPARRAMTVDPMVALRLE